MGAAWAYNGRIHVMKIDPETIEGDYREAFQQMTKYWEEKMIERIHVSPCPPKLIRSFKNKNKLFINALKSIEGVSEDLINKTR